MSAGAVLAGDRETRAPGSPLTVALAGNPNAGKTTLFNALTGLRQKVANYPGVTVERKEGPWPLDGDGRTARLVDLPGLYSLDAASPDEQIARAVLSGRSGVLPAPDCVVAVVDATNLERNLYLVTQLMDLGRPLVVALTMTDLADRRGIAVDPGRLSEALGVAVVPVSAAKRSNLDLLARRVAEAAAAGSAPDPGWRLSDAAEGEIARLAAAGLGRAEAVEALYGTTAEPAPGFSVKSSAGPDAAVRAAADSARARLAGGGEGWWQEPVLARYRWIEEVAAASLGGANRGPGAADRIDRVLTHRALGPVVLLAVALLIFQTIFSLASLPMDLIDHGFGALAEAVRGAMPPGLLAELLADGVIPGVGGVLVFLPQILLLFLFIALLEDSGYMARAAFLLDRVMRGVGLHGKAFLPLMSSFACAIPGVMATRTIENPKDRLATILIAPFMSCSARLPVYALMIAAFFTGQTVFGFLSAGAVVLTAMYVLGILTAVAVAWVLKRTILKAPPPPLVMELPPYRVPRLANVLHAMTSQSWLFVRRAGTVILAISILLWALAAFPRVDRAGGADASAAAAADDGGTGQLRQSYAGRIGRFIEPAIEPLGFDWQMGVGLIGSFAAREVFVSTLSITYGVGRDADAESPSLLEAVRGAKKPDGSPAWTPLVAVTMMVFFVLACQCVSTLAVVRRETNSWRWPAFMLVYMCVLAYVAAFLTYQGGRLLGLG